MTNKSSKSILQCGKVFDVSFPEELTKSDPPIDLAKVNIKIKGIKNPNIIFNYSQIIEFQNFGLNPIISITYRLIRTCNKKKQVKKLDEWNLLVSNVFPTTIPKINTIEPLVLNFCDCLSGIQSERLIYTLQIVEVITNNSTYNITNEEISAIGISGTSH
ncbi:DUF4489 domain-containing protein [Cytobacillus sp. Hm23]